MLPASVSAQRFHHRPHNNGTPTDTVIKFNRPAKVVIVEEGKSVKPCHMEGDGLSYNIANTRHGQWNLVTGGLGFGLNGAINQPEGTGLQMGKSFEVMWLKTLAAEYKFNNHAVSAGIGLDWKNFKMTGDPYRMYKEFSDGIGVAPYPETAIPLNSTLKIFSLDIPVLYSYDLPRYDLKFTAGPILNFNTHSSLKTNYINAEGNKVTEFEKGLDLNVVTFELFGSVSWKCLGLYLKGQPIKSLKNPSTVNFNPFTVGVIFFM